MPSKQPQNDRSAQVKLTAEELAGVKEAGLGALLKVIELLASGLEVNINVSINTQNNAEYEELDEEEEEGSDFDNRAAEMMGMCLGHFMGWLMDHHPYLDGYVYHGVLLPDGYMLLFCDAKVIDRMWESINEIEEEAKQRLGVVQLTISEVVDKTVLTKEYVQQELKSLLEDRQFDNTDFSDLKVLHKFEVNPRSPKAASPANVPKKGGRRKLKLKKGRYRLGTKPAEDKDEANDS